LKSNSFSYPTPTSQTSHKKKNPHPTLIEIKLFLISYTHPPNHCIKKIPHPTTPRSPITPYAYCNMEVRRFGKDPMDRELHVF
jgi:hypothetical protein